jgi:hypothetical protein
LIHCWPAEWGEFSKQWSRIQRPAALCVNGGRSGAERLVQHTTSRRIARDLSHYNVQFISQIYKYLIHARELASVAASDLILQTFEREIAISALNSDNFCVWVCLVMLAAAQIITCTMLAGRPCGPQCIPPTRTPLGMSTRALLPRAAVQVVLVELGGPLRPCQMPKIRPFDQVQYLDFNLRKNYKALGNSLILNTFVL